MSFFQKNFLTAPSNKKPAAHKREKTAPEEHTTAPSRNDYKPGEHVKGKGIYVGMLTPDPTVGLPANARYYIFAAAEDLKDQKGERLRMNFNEAARELAARRNIDGHSGGYYLTEADLYADLRKDAYKGEWFIPPRSFLNGTSTASAKTAERDLYGLRNEGAFKGSFVTDTKGRGLAHWYLSLSEADKNPQNIYAVEFEYGGSRSFSKDAYHMSCRACRLEKAPVPQ